MTTRVVVVGAGLGGLAASIRLAHAGYQVTVLERNQRPGGKMNLLEDQGFLFDTGPTILTMPQVLDRLCASVGRRREEFLDLRPIDPQWRAFFEDGEVIDVWGNREKMEEEIRRVSPVDVKGYRAFRQYAQRMYQTAEQFFFWRNMGGLSDLLKPFDVVGTRGLRLVLSIDFLSTVSRVIDRHFKDPHLRQTFEHFMQYVGSSPHRVPAILASIHHIQLEFGVWYPMGGTHRVADALIQLAQEFGVNLRVGVQVDRIVSTESGSGKRRVTGVEAGGQFFPAEGIVANSDFVRSHRELLPATATRRQIERTPKRFEPTCSGIILYFGLDRKYDQLRHHDFFFSRDAQREFEDIYRRKVPTQDPTLCVCAPSRTDPSVAPPGCENVYVLVHTPYLREGQEEWDRFYGPYRDLIIGKLERCGLKGFRRAIRVEHHMTPQDLEERYRVDRGAIYGMVSHGRLRGGFKPANRSKDFTNLYFCGGSVNPGPGVPMVLMSGQIAAECLLEDLCKD